MNKTKIKNFALLFTLLLFVVSLAFSVFTVFRADAEEPSAAEDVGVEISTHEDLVKTTDNNIYGKENVTAVGWTGWGGFAKSLTFTETKDLSAIADSGKGALSFWLYIPDQAVLDIYKARTASQRWNFDISSNETYSDDYKWTFTMLGTDFANARIGWQRIVMPFSAVGAGDKKGMDWSAVKSARLNTTGFGVSGGYTGKVADVSFTTTNLPKNTITGDPVVTFGHGAVSGVDTETMNIPDLGESFTAYYNKDKGGFLTVLALNQVYSVNKTSDSALSVWVYFDRETDKSALNAYNIDISSGESYSDSHKYCINIKPLFKNCSVGWNQLIIPLESANEKNNMDWNDVRNIRLNVDGGAACRVAMANMQIIHSGVTEPTVVGYVEPSEPEPDRTVTLTEEGGIVSFSNLGGLSSNADKPNLEAIKQLDENTTAQYVIGNMNGDWSTWGGMVRPTVFDKPYNVGAISTNAKGAFVFWLYIHNQGTLDKMQSGTGFNLNLSSGEDFSDAKKWEYNIAPLAKDCMIGWNKIVIPFASSMCVKQGGGPETANTVGNLRFVVLDGAVSGQGDLAFADFGFFLTEETEPVVINQKTQMTRPDDASFGVGSAADLTADTELLEGKTAYSAIGKNWGAKTQLITFDKAYDLSNHDVYGKSVLSFGIYFADEATLEAHRAITNNYFVTLGSGGEFNAANGYAFDISGLFADCSVGWNTVYLPVGTADNKGAIDWSNVKFLQIAWDKAFGEGECEVAFAEFKLISTDDTARSVENDSGISLGISAVEELEKMQLVRNKKNVTSYSTIGKGWGRLNEKKFTLVKSYNASKFETNGAFAFWFYIENENTLNAHKAVTDNYFITLYSGDYKGATKMTFEIHSVFADCIVGWNKIVLPFSAGTNSSLDFGAVSSFSINQDKATPVDTGKNEIALAEFSIIATDLAQMTVTEKISSIEEGLNPIAEKIIIDCNVTNGLTFAGNKVDTQDLRYGTGCVYTSGAGYALNAQFEGGETDLRKNTLILAFWLWIEDPAYYFESDGTTLKSGINGQVELASSQPWDTNEINWEIRQWGVEKMQKGWNWIVLKGEDGNISGGNPNFDALMRFRIYVNGIQQSTMKIDRITIGSSEKLLTAPDWEKEVIGNDPGTGFKGPNAYMPANDSYIGVDFDNGAKGFTTTVTEIIKEKVKVTKTEEGCSSALTVVPVAFTVLIGVAAICFVVVRKRKNDGK